MKIFNYHISNKSTKNNVLFQLLLVFLLAFIVRLPYYLGPHFYFDGDDAILGIMTQDLLKGENIPVYFYGQQYGFAFFDVLANAVFMLFLGSGIWTLKLGSLLLYSIGNVFLFRLFLKKGAGFWQALLMIAFVASYPIWVTKGIYPTGYALACFVLLKTETEKLSYPNGIVVALLVALLLVSQVVLLIPIGLLILYWLKPWENGKIFIVFLLSTLVFYFLLKWPSYYNKSFFEPRVSKELNIPNLLHMLPYLGHAFMGWFLNEITFPMSNKALVLCIIAMSGIVGFIIYVMRQSTKETRLKVLFVLLGSMAVLGALAYMRLTTYRYLLGFYTGFLFILVLLLCYSIQIKRNVNRFVIALLLVQLGCSLTSYQIPSSWMEPQEADMPLFKELISEIEKRNIKHVFTTDGWLQWMLNYYHPNGLNARSCSIEERIDRYSIKVTNCYPDTTCKTAVVGFRGNYNEMDYIKGWNEKVEAINKRFYIYENPERLYLEKGGFQLK